MNYVQNTADMRAAYGLADRDIMLPGNTNLLLFDFELGTKRLDELEELGSVYRRSLHLR